MGKKIVQRKKCTGKTRYPSQAFAIKGIERLRAATGHMDLLTTYPCGWCQGWHFGHPPRRVLKRIRAQILRKAANDERAPSRCATSEGTP